MKRYLTLSVLFCFLSTLSFAQEDETTNVSLTQFGAKAGVNFSTMSGGDIQDQRIRTGLNIGAVANFVISYNFAVQIEGILSAQGYKQRLESQEAVHKYDYLNFPVLADIRIGEGFTFQAGPQVGFNITSKLEINQQGNTRLNANSFDLSAVGGFQYTFPEGLFVQARYNHGFLEVRENQEFTNSVISLSVGYYFK